MKKPVDEWTHELQENGRGKTIRRYSYGVMLCEKQGSLVQAIRVEFYRNKEEVMQVVKRQYPDWNIAHIRRLYDEDFD